MQARILKSIAIPACALLAWSLQARADEKNAAKTPAAGTWTKKEGQMRIEFGAKGVMKLYPHGDKAEIALICKCSLDKDGLLNVKVTDHEGNEEIKKKLKNVVPVGFQFTCHWKAKGESATLENIDGKDTEAIKSHLEGEYEKKSE